MHRLIVLSALALWALPACNNDVQPQTTPDAGPPPHKCTTEDEAAANAECKLELGGAEQKSWLATETSRDYWLLDVPTTLPGTPLSDRPVLEVLAQYKVTHTPVHLSVNVVKAGGGGSVVSGMEPADAASPQPVRLSAVMPAAGRYFVIVQHIGNGNPYYEPAKDPTNPYFITAAVKYDLDKNGHTSATATPIKLSCGGLTQANGVLTLSGAKDVFKLQAQSCSATARTILYFSVEVPAPVAGDPALQQMMVRYSLCQGATCTDAGTGVIAGDRAASPMVKQLIATARALDDAALAGNLELKIDAYSPGQDTAPGSANFTFTVNAGLYPDRDGNEGKAGNDTPATATPVTFDGSGKATVSGRVSFVPDLDTWAVTSPTAARLYYKLSLGAKDGAFPALPIDKDRHLTVFTTKDSDPACAQDKCVHHERWECTGSKCAGTEDLANFEGELPLSANATYYLQYGYSGGEKADDNAYSIALEKRSGGVQHTEANPITVALSDHSDTDPGAQATIGWGYGPLEPGPTSSAKQLPRNAVANMDFDAENEIETFEYTFTPDSADHTLYLQWAVANTPVRPYDVGLRFTFFNADGSKVVVPSQSQMFAYVTAALSPWYAGGATQQQYDLSEAGGTATFTMKDSMCACLQKSHAAAGKFLVTVVPYGRTSYADAVTSLKIKWGGYPAAGCPATCGFADYFKSH